MTFSKNLLSIWTNNGEFWIEKYDVLQVKRYGSEWMDYATIKDSDDATYAVNFLRGKGNPTCDWEKIEGFRIVRNYKTILTSRSLV